MQALPPCRHYHERIPRMHQGIENGKVISSYIIDSEGPTGELFTSKIMTNQPADESKESMCHTAQVYCQAQGLNLLSVRRVYEIEQEMEATSKTYFGIKERNITKVAIWGAVLLTVFNIGLDIALHFIEKAERDDLIALRAESVSGLIQHDQHDLNEIARLNHEEVRLRDQNTELRRMIEELRRKIAS